MDLQLYSLLHPAGEHISSSPGKATCEEKTFLSQSVHSLGALVHCEYAQVGLPSWKYVSCDTIIEKLIVLVHASN